MEYPTCQLRFLDMHARQVYMWSAVFSRFRRGQAPLYKL